MLQGKLISHAKRKKFYLVVADEFQFIYLLDVNKPLVNKKAHFKCKEYTRRGQAKRPEQIKNLQKCHILTSFSGLKHPNLRLLFIVYSVVSFQNKLL